MGKVWTLQDAGARFTTLAEAARDGEPQRVTLSDDHAVVVMSADAYELMAKRPKTFVEHLLSAPKLPDDCQDLFDKREPIILEMREIDFDE